MWEAGKIPAEPNGNLYLMGIDAGFEELWKTSAVLVTNDESPVYLGTSLLVHQMIAMSLVSRFHIDSVRFNLSMTPAGVIPSSIFVTP